MSMAPAMSPALEASGRSLFGIVEPRRLLKGGRSAEHQAPAVRLLASSAARRGQLTRAGRLLWDLVVSNPRDREMRINLVSVMIMRDQPIEALTLLEEMLAERPEDARAAERKAFILMQLGRLDEALEIYSRLVAAHQDYPPLLLARGNVLLATGKAQAAAADYYEALGRDPGYGEAWWALANIKTARFSTADLGSMQSLLAHSELNSTARINLEFALGKAFEDAGDYERSFAHYRRGNEYQSIGAFDATGAAQGHVDQVIDCFGADGLSGRTGAEMDGPIFIVGMPRSGTTLLEQILASHPDIEGTAELPTISAIARSLGEGIGRTEFNYSSLLKSYSDDGLKALGKRYLEKSAAYRRTDRPFFIDKMPSNWMHVALIKLILPRARIIDIRRDPLDCCFSNFAQHYPRGHEYTHRLEDLGTQYRNYERLIAQFDRIAPGAVIRLQYERLVDDPETVVRELLQRLGLPFAESCLRFFENDRAVRTPSAQQVRQPINRKGIGRAQPYLPWLGPLVDALRPA